jgi:large subunit ribosomal protein L18
MLTNYDRRKFRVRSKIASCNKSSRPRVVVFRSNKNIYAQLVNEEGKIIASFSTMNIKEKKGVKGIERAKIVGKEFAKNCLKDGIKEVVFDKGAYAYGGQVKALAEACRESGLSL